MSITDPIADMFTRIRNAQHAGHKDVVIPYSKVKERIGAILLNEGFISALSVLDIENNKKALKVAVKYCNKVPLIKEIKRVSKPSKRIYVQKSQVPKVLGGYGICIVSTSKGVLSGRDARLNNVGGELLAIVS